MKVSTYTWQRIVLSIGTLALVSACGGGGSGSGSSSATDSSALKVDSKISIMEPKASKSASKVSLLSRSSGESRSATASRDPALPATSAYEKDITFYYVQDESSESLNIVNSLLCKFDKVAATEMVVSAPKVDYIALIDEAMCDQEKGSKTTGSEGGSSNESGGKRPELSSWTVNTEMTDVDTMVVKIWVLNEMDYAPEDSMNANRGQKKMEAIRAKMTVNRGVNGQESTFTMNFAMYEVDEAGNKAEIPHIKGFLNKTVLGVGNNKVDFYSEALMFGGTYPEGVSITYNPLTGTGSGISTAVKYDEELRQEKNVQNNFSYNLNNFYREDVDGKTSCMNRNDFHETAWRYGLYDSGNGERIEVNSGFPISKEIDGVTYQGWAGNWGVWMPEEAGVKNGSKVKKDSFKEGVAAEDFTIVQTEGRLRKHTRKILPMSEIKNIPLMYWNGSKEFQVIWNGTQLVKVAKRDQNSNWIWSKMVEEPVTFTEGTFEFSFYAQSLGGAGQIKFGNEGEGKKPVVTAASTVIFHSETTVFVGDTTVPKNLVCYDNCIKAGSIDEANFTDRFHPNNYDNANEEGIVPIQYTYENDVLTSGITPVTSTTYNQNKEGIWSGALIPDTSSNRNSLKCTWNTDICAWQLYDKIDVFYTWSTGPNEWDKTTSLRSDVSNEVVAFDLPKLVEYTHKGEGKYKDTTFYLDYEGFGNLWGIPEVCMYIETGVTTDCWNVPEADFISRKVRYMSQFVIPESVEGIRSTASESTKIGKTTYVIKPLDVEQSQKSVDEGACNTVDSGLTLAAMPDTFPLNLEGWVDPAIGEMPAVVGAPKVISGVVQ